MAEHIRRYDVMGPARDPSLTRAAEHRPMELIIDMKESPGHWHGRAKRNLPPFRAEAVEIFLSYSATKISTRCLASAGKRPFDGEWMPAPCLEVLVYV